MLRWLATVAVLASSVPARADDAFDPDYVFDFMSCRSQGSSLGSPSAKNDGFVDMKAKGHQTGCVRTGKKSLDCITVFEEAGAKPVRYGMTITAELSEMLVIESEDGSGADYFVVKPSTGRVVSTTRMVGANYLAVKLCHGIFMTGDEFKAMQAKMKAKPRRD